MSASRAERGLWRSHANVLTALMLRDVRTRMGSTPAFLLAVLWPLTHIVVVVAFQVFSGRVAPYGDSIIVWSAIGVVPFMCFSYISRFTMLSLVMNKPLLYFPAIRIPHIIIARSIIEVLNLSLVVLMIYLLSLALDIELAPVDPPTMALAILVAMGIGVGMGLIMGILAAVLPAMMAIYPVTLVVLWITSGVFFVPSALPKRAIDILQYHPLVHCVEWARSGYFEAYSSVVLDKAYAVLWVIG
jgi:capsular polysaccharide transport system permease protein